MWSSLLKVKMEVFGIPGKRSDAVAVSDISRELTSVQLHFNLLFALCEKETLEPAWVISKMVLKWQQG